MWWWVVLWWLGRSGEGAKENGRLLWVTRDGRLALPPGTLLTITPTISLPFVRYPPDGFLSNMTISLPFTINFDVLGLTDNQNPYGVLPPAFGRSAGAWLADYIAALVHSRHPRSPLHPSLNPLLHGGERALLYLIAEDFLSNFGLNGRACLLRAICEVHGYSLKHFGFFGEVIKLFFTASKSPYAHILEDYVKAEEQGRNQGECFPYFKNCPKSLFIAPERNKYMMDIEDHAEMGEQMPNEENLLKQETTQKDSSKLTMTKDFMSNIM